MHAPFQGFLIQPVIKGVTADADTSQGEFALNELPIVLAQNQLVNPWGILHGGLTGLLMEQAARRAGVAEPTDFVVRYLRAVKEGPGVVRVVETVDRDDTRLVRLELVDAGADRVAVVATIGGRRA